MPRFSNTEAQRHRSSDVIQRTKRLLAAVQSRHRRLQLENQQLQSEESLLQAYCDCADWLRQRDGAVDSQSAVEQQLLQQLGLHPTPAAVGQQPLADDSQLPKVADNSISAATTATDSSIQEVLHPSGTGVDNGSNSGGNRTSSRKRDSSLHSSGARLNPAEPVAPVNDCMRFLRQVLSPGLTLGLENVTVEKVNHDYVATVKELSLNCQQYEAQIAQQDAAAAAHMWPEGQQPVDRIEAIICRLLRLWWSLFAINRQEVVQQLMLTNFATRELIPEPDKAHHSWVVTQLELSEDQKQRIASGFSLFKRIITPALEELKQLQLQLQATDESEDTQPPQPQFEQDGSSGPPSCSRSSLHTEDGAPAGEAPIPNTSPPSPSLSAALAEDCGMSCKYMPLSQGHAAYRKRLAEQEQRYQRMYMLMRKDMFHRAVFTGYMYGCLSYYQHAKLLCLMYPYCPAAAVVGQVVFEQVKRELQQQPSSRPPRQPQQRTKQRPK